MLETVIFVIVSNFGEWLYSVLNVKFVILSMLTMERFYILYKIVWSVLRLSILNCVAVSFKETHILDLNLIKMDQLLFWRCWVSPENRNVHEWRFSYYDNKLNLLWGPHLGTLGILDLIILVSIRPFFRLNEY